MMRTNTGRVGALGLIVGTLVGCSASAAKKGDSDSDGDGRDSGDSVEAPNEEEAYLSSCEGHDCPSGTREGVREVCEDSKVGARLLRRLTRRELERTLEDIFPEVVSEWGGVELTQDPVSSLGFSTDAKTLVVNGPTFKNMLETAEGLAELVTEPGTLAALLPCSETGADSACAEELVNRYGLRLFRRPLSETEVERYVSYHQSVAARSDFATGAKWALSVMMQSPAAFYRSEIGEPSDEGHQLTQYELATNLAYTYAGTTPSAELLAKAQASELKDSASLEAVASSLLDDEKNWDTSHQFFREWLGYERVLNQSRAEEPNFAATISPLLVTETQLFLQQIVFSGGTVQDLMTARFTALDSELSTFYGFGDVTPEDGFLAVERPEGRGIGVLAQGSLLAATGHQDETSPTLRGLLFTEEFLCIEPPAPPDIVPPLSEAEGIEEAKTTREKYELHHATGGCASCHSVFDPYGFTFEQFDETGRYRENEDGEPIDTSATVRLPGGEEMSLSNLDSLSSMVQENDHVENCMSGLLSTYMLSGGGGSNCLAEEARSDLASGKISIRDYMVKLAGTPHFSKRGI